MRLWKSTFGSSLDCFSTHYELSFITCLNIRHYYAGKSVWFLITKPCLNFKQFFVHLVGWVSMSNSHELDISKEVSKCSRQLPKGFFLDC